MAMRRRQQSRRGRKSFFWLVLVAAAGFGFVTTQAFTASNAVPATNIGQFTQAITPVQLEPAECISSGITVTSIVAGAGTITSTAANQLVLGSSGADTLNDTAFGANCMVGGAGADAFNGLNKGGDLCIASTATATASIKQCTVVARRP
jgi:hypothetical protein